MILGGILKRSEDNGVPSVAPVSDSSASSSDSDFVTRSRTRLDLPPQRVPLEVGGEEFREKPVNGGHHRVSFGELEIRKYGIILGDHPNCEMGPPVSCYMRYLATLSSHATSIKPPLA